MERFAEKYVGRTVSFDAHIAAMDNHGSYKTRYDRESVSICRKADHIAGVLRAIARLDLPSE